MPDLNVLIITGDTNPSMQIDNVEVLAKPFRRRDIAAPAQLVRRLAFLSEAHHADNSGALQTLFETQHR